MPKTIGNYSRAKLNGLIKQIALAVGLDCAECDGDDLIVDGNITLNEYIYHNGDADTFIRFAPDLVNLVAGGFSAIKYEKSAGKIIINNTNENVDFHVMAEDNTELLTTDAANNRVGIGRTDPEAYLDIKNTVDDGTTNRTMLRLHNYRSDDADVNDFGPISIDFDIENVHGGAKTGTARITAVSAPVGTNHALTAGEKSSGLIFSTMNDDTLAEAVRINAVGNVGIGTTAPLSPLSIKQPTDDDAGAITLMESDDSNDVWSIHRTSTYLKFNRATDGSTFSDVGHIDPASAPGQIDFTGQHRSAPCIGSVSDYTDKTGLIVIASGQHFSLSDSPEINIDESLPTVKLAEQRSDKRAFGVVSNVEDSSDPQRSYSAGSWGTSYKKREGDHRLIINSLGEGAVWVSNVNGDLENGDYITTCEIPGYGMKQSDDLLHNYTVAKITQDCSFELSGSTYQCKEINFSGSVHKAAFVGCTYHCG